MTHYPKAIFALALLTIPPLLFLLSLYVNVPLGFAVWLGVISAALLLFAGFEAFADGEESDNTEDKESADEKPEEYKEDETDLYDIIVNKPAGTTADEKPADTDAATETTDNTAGTVAEDETDDKA